MPSPSFRWRLRVGRVGPTLPEAWFFPRGDSPPTRRAAPASRQVRSWIAARSPDQLQRDRRWRRPGRRGRRRPCRPACPPAARGRRRRWCSRRTSPRSAAARPRAIARAHSAETTPCCSTTAPGTPSTSILTLGGVGDDAAAVDLRDPGHLGEQRRQPAAGQRLGGGERGAPRSQQASSTTAVGRGLDRFCVTHAATVPRMALPIEDYALIGDRHTAALVGKNGSIDWLCLPRFDSPACFAGLLGDDSHGHWQLCPTGDYDVTPALRRRLRRPGDDVHHRRRRGHAARRDADRRRPGRRRAHGHRRARHGADAARVGGPDGLRRDPAVGAPPRHPRRGGRSPRSPARTSWSCADPGCRSATSTATSTSSTSRRATS